MAVKLIHFYKMLLSQYKNLGESFLAPFASGEVIARFVMAVVRNKNHNMSELSCFTSYETGLAE